MAKALATLRLCLWSPDNIFFIYLTALTITCITRKQISNKKEEKKPKVEKTITGKKATEVKVDPDLEETKELDKMKKETKLKGKNLQAACGGGAAPSAGMTGS